jgi:Protein kinase domain
VSWTAPEVTRIDEPFVADERTMLYGWLEWQRATLLCKCAGLTAEQLAERPARRQRAAAARSCVSPGGDRRCPLCCVAGLCRENPPSLVRCLYPKPRPPDGALVSRETEPALPYSGMSGQIGHYRLSGYIGRGAMAVVYLAQDQRTGGNVALKVVAPELASDAAFRARFLRESRMAAAVSHPHIIPVYEADEAGGNLYVAMRYVQGGDARSLLNRHGPLPAAWAWNIIAGVASALDAAHAHGLIHGDVRPANMLLDASGPANGTAQPGAGGDPGHVYLSDFGMSRSSPSGEVIAAGQVEPLDYAAPEQIEKHDLDGRADLYSLACAGFELLCGTPPFGQDQGLTLMYAQLYAPPPSAAARRPDLPAAVDSVLATALAKNPEDRFRTCGQFADALHAALGVAPGEAAEPGWQAAVADPARPAPGTWPGHVQQGPAAPDAGQHYPAPDATQHYPAPDATLTGAPAPHGPGNGPGWQQPPLPPPPAAPAGPGADFVSRLRGAYPQPGRLPTGRRLVFAVAAVAVVIVGIVVGLAVSGGSSPSTPAASSHATSPAPSAPAGTVASRQAAAVSSLLSSSAATRRSLEGAVAEVRNCSSLSSATSQIQAVARQRSAEYRRASALSMAALANAAVVKSDLLAALRASLDADRDYLTWARQQLRSGCTPASQSSAYNAAFSADAQAGSAKAAFVQVWNPVAAKYGDPQESPGDI